MRNRDKMRLYTFPFTRRFEDKSGKFSRGMELATIFWKAEMERKKESEFLGTKGEETLFVAAGYYPFWVLPLEGKIAIIDGMSQLAHRVTYHRIPNTESFMNDLISGDSRSVFSRILTRYQGIFSQPPMEKEEVIEGLVAERGLQEDLLKIMGERRELDEKTVQGALSLEPLIPLERVDMILSDIKALLEEVDRESTNLEKASVILSQKTTEHMNQVKNEIAEIERNYRLQISDSKPIIEKEIEELEKDQLREVKQVTDQFDAGKSCYLEGLRKIEGAIKSLEKEKTGLKHKLEVTKKRRDQETERVLKKNFESKDTALNQFTKEMGKIEKEIKRLEDEKNLEVQKCKTYYDLQTIEKTKPLKELEAKMKTEVDSKKAELEELRKNSSQLNGQIKALSILMKGDAERLSAIAVKDNISESCLFMMPFYVSSFRAGNRQRYSVFSPSTPIGKKGMLNTLLQKMGKTDFPVIPAYESVKTLLEVKLPQTIDENPILKTDIARLGEKNNLVLNADIRKLIKAGLEELAEGGWLSEKRYKELSENDLLKRS